MPLQQIQTKLNIRPQIIFNGYSLQSNYILSRDINFRHLPDKVVNIKPDPGRGGFRVLDTYYDKKIIEVAGWIIRDSEANLRTEIDNLKKALLPQEKYLEIKYGDGVIRYKATCQRLEIPEEFFHITQVPFRAEFIALPWGTDVVLKTETVTGITSSPYSGYFDIRGSFPPFPVIEIKINSETNMTSIKFKNDTSGDEITVARTYSAGEVLSIDTENQTVQVDGIDVDFSGVFPEFEVMAKEGDTSCLTRNDWTLTVTDTGAFSVDLTLKYYPTWL